MAITIACHLWGVWGDEYGIDYVVKLRSMVFRHLSVPHRFVCFTDREMPSFIETLPMDVPNWRWNLRKMILYKPENGLEGRVISLDLDIVILGSIDFLAGYQGRFCTLEDMWVPNVAGGGINSFETNTLTDELYSPLEKDGFKIGWEIGGSERLWYRRQVPNADLWQDLYPGHIAGFKPTSTTRLTKVPDGISIVAFHGKPKPHEVVDEIPWVKENWR